MKPILKEDDVVEILYDNKGNKIRVWSSITLYENILNDRGVYGCGIYKAGGIYSLSPKYCNKVWDSMHWITNDEASQITELKADIQETFKRFPYLNELNKGETNK